MDANDDQPTFMGLSSEIKILILKQIFTNPTVGVRCGVDNQGYTVTGSLTIDTTSLHMPILRSPLRPWTIEALSQLGVSLVLEDSPGLPLTKTEVYRVIRNIPVHIKNLVVDIRQDLHLGRVDCYAHAFPKLKNLTIHDNEEYFSLVFLYSGPPGITTQIRAQMVATPFEMYRSVMHSGKHDQGIVVQHQARMVTRSSARAARLAITHPNRTMYDPILDPNRRFQIIVYAVVDKSLAVGLLRNGLPQFRSTPFYGVAYNFGTGVLVDRHGFNASGSRRTELDTTVGNLENNGVHAILMQESR